MAVAEEERARSADLSFTAETGRIRALAESLADSDLPVALLLAAEAHRRDPSPTSLGVFQKVFVAGDARVGFLTLEDRIRAVHVGDHGEVIGVGDETITVWDPTTGRVTATVPLTVPVLDIGDTVQIGFHPIAFGGTLVAWLGTDSVVRLVDLAGTPPTAHEIGPGRGTPAIDTRRPEDRHTRIRRSDHDVHAARARDDVADARRRLRELGRAAARARRIGARGGSVVPRREHSCLRRRPGVCFCRDGVGRSHPSTRRQVSLGRSRFTPDANGEFADQPSGSLMPWPGDPNLVVAKGKYTVSIRNVDDLSEVARIRYPGGVADLEAVAPLLDGRMAVLHRSGDVLIVDTAGTVVQPAVDAGLGVATNLAVSHDGRHLFVSGERGVATVALDGSTLVRSTIDRPDGHVVFGGTSGAIWVASEEPPAGLPGEHERTPSRIWRCLDRQPPCTEITAAGLDSRTYLGGVSSESRPDLIFLYRVPPDGTDTAQLVDAFTLEPRSALIPTAGKGNGAWAIAPDASWIALDHLNPPGIVVYSTLDGHRIAEFPATEQTCSSRWTPMARLS